jgi:hypothetical protein
LFLLFEFLIGVIEGQGLEQSDGAFGVLWTDLQAKPAHSLSVESAGRSDEVLFGREAVNAFGLE